MRLVAAYCSAIYTGRGDTKLGNALRAIMIKADGSVSIHNDVSNKPLNYMKEATFTESFDEEGKLVWTFDQRKESLQITLHEIVSDFEVPLVTDDEGLERDGTEAHLQEWLSENLDALGEGHTLVGREFPTGDGPVDLFVSHESGQHYAVEVKRIAILSSVYQVKRYVDALNSPQVVDEQSSDEEGDEPPDYGEVKGVIAALDIRPKAAALAEKRGIKLITLPADWKESRKGNL